jgi:citrate lyase beta subunit
MGTAPIAGVRHVSEQQILADLAHANSAQESQFPGDHTANQPMHTVYESAALFDSQRVTDFANAARDHSATHLSDPSALVRILEITETLANRAHPILMDMLSREPVQDYRLDFEDGFGVHADDYEDQVVVRSAQGLAEAMRLDTLPRYIGIRTKPFNSICVNRSTRTIDLFLATLLTASDGVLPNNFVVTLPKVTNVSQVTALVQWLTIAEKRHNLAPNSVLIELMVETTQSLFDADGRSLIPQLLKAAKPRCRGVHFGTYDYTASAGLSATEQRNDHPACDFARHLIKVGCAGTGVWLSDGSSNLLPIGEATERSLLTSFKQVSSSLSNGYFQGWDLHPGQVGARYAAVIAFYLPHLADHADRLKLLISAATVATSTGAVFDDVATGQGLLSTIARAYHAGIISDSWLADAELAPQDLAHGDFARLIHTVD